ncbi:BNR repeat-like domain-containing protein [Verrucomicrobium sp. GAS474]|uniref:sialidase family protein n=1 Tax=Verrucomicrobium sp. GAS474 TaxID=1882831 RepID=UPI00087C6260|nr:sialidase family protein [Verrucomicrobium sp. GAS474]SDT94812.1 BNR repeat-like domain-containing protein [Verrucomicrobium sp. GAS474]
MHTPSASLDLNIEVLRTQPDYIAYLPDSTDRATGQTGNEHFLVEPLPGGGLFAVWTQSSHEGEPDQHIVFATSHDGGRTWSAPATIAGPDEAKKQGMTSWGFPLVSKSGRIYVLYSRHIGVNDIFTHTTGLMACIYSDDLGKSWSAETILPMPRSSWDNPDPAVPANWIVWQKPVRLSTGQHFTGVTRWVSPQVHRPTPRSEWWAEATVVEFLRFENVDDDPAPQDLSLTWLCQNENALQIGLLGHPDLSVIQEPSWVELPDQRLFCVMRTTLGSPYYTVSADEGETWTRPEPLRQYDDGPILPHPCSPCPIYPLDSSNFIFLYHNHDGNFLHYTPAQTSDHRRPICLARAEFRPGARQPLWFSEPWFFMDNGGIPILRTDLAMYASTTRTDDGLILWYPERKFFLLGKKIPEKMVKALAVKEIPARD